MANEKKVRKLTATNMLKAKFAELNLTQGEVAEKLGISKQSLSYKLNNKLEFKASEIKALSKILKIVDKDAYFFYDNDSQNG